MQDALENGVDLQSRIWDLASKIVDAGLRGRWLRFWPRLVERGILHLRESLGRGREYK